MTLPLLFAINLKLIFRIIFNSKSRLFQYFTEINTNKDNFLGHGRVDSVTSQGSRFNFRTQVTHSKIPQGSLQNLHIEKKCFTKGEE